MRKKIFFLLKLILVITIFYWIIKSVNLTETYNTLLKANLILVVIAFLMNNLSNIFLTIKWYRLSKPLKLKSSFMELLKLNYISVFYSSFLPGQTSGELVKGAKLTKTEGAVQKVWIPIFIDKATNLLITFLIGFVAIIMDENLRNNNYLLFSVSIATLLFTFITMILFSEHTEKAIRFLKDKLVQVMDIFKIDSSLIKQLSVSYFDYYKKHDLLMLETLCWSTLVKIPHIFALYFLALSLNITIDITQAAWLFAVVFLVTILPVTFSGLGVREGAVIIILSEFGIDKSSALGLSVLIFTLGIAMALIGGICELFPNSHKK
ncbi:MAG: flippase-like domain-containing protein [Candidatus Melainabacteria bacterium]|nr:flippase-like domain-containing protein [Candidatus Melainabacteria bacterium]